LGFDNIIFDSELENENDDELEFDQDAMEAFEILLSKTKSIILTQSYSTNLILSIILK
jgi:hypothetical protein